MSFTETATAIGLLAPLLLGVLAFAKDIITRKDKSTRTDEQKPAVLQGMAVAPDFAGELIAELRKDLLEKEAELKKAQAQIDIYKEIDRK